MQPTRLRQSITIYQDRRILSIFCLGILSGLPWVLVGSMLSIWLKEMGISRTDIGFASFILFVYTINFLWSPLIDQIKPKFGFVEGRQAWVGLCQLMMAGMCLLLYIKQPSADTAIFLVAMCFGIAVASATQDIALDAFRVNAFKHNEKDKIIAAASVATAGWWTGYAGIGAIPLYLSDQNWEWPALYLFCSAMSIIVYFISILLVKEQSLPKDETDTPPPLKYSNWFYEKILLPLHEFFIRHGIKFALSIMLFIFLFKIGESFLGRMSIVFYKEMGYSNTDISNYSKLLTWLVTVVAAFTFSYVSHGMGTVRSLFIAGVFMALSNLMFIAIHQTGPSVPLYMATCIVDGVAYTWSTVAFVAFISQLCSHRFSATQYALLASLGSLGRTILSGFSGKMVDALDGNWTIFFVITIVMVIPALTLLMYLKTRIDKDFNE